MSEVGWATYLDQNAGSSYNMNQRPSQAEDGYFTPDVFTNPIDGAHTTPRRRCRTGVAARPSHPPRQIVGRRAMPAAVTAPRRPLCSPRLCVCSAPRLGGVHQDCRERPAVNRFSHHLERHVGRAQLSQGRDRGQRTHHQAEGQGFRPGPPHHRHSRLQLFWHAELKAGCWPPRVGGECGIESATRRVSYRGSSPDCWL